MSDKRAYYRRMKRLPMEERIFYEGQEQGVRLGTAICLMAVHELFGFSSFKSGTGKLDKLIDECQNQWNKMEEEPTQIYYDHVMRLLTEKTGVKVD